MDKPVEEKKLTVVPRTDASLIESRARFMLPVHAGLLIGLSTYARAAELVVLTTGPGRAARAPGRPPRNVRSAESPTTAVDGVPNAPPRTGARRRFFSNVRVHGALRNERGHLVASPLVEFATNCVAGRWPRVSMSFTVTCIDLLEPRRLHADDARASTVAIDNQEFEEV